MVKVLKYQFIVLLILGVHSFGLAQINVDVGLQVAYMPFSPVRDIIDGYNNGLPAEAKKMKRMTVIPGILAGLSTNSTIVKFHLEYEGLFGSTNAKRLKDAEGNTYKNIFNLSRSSAGAGLSGFLGSKLSLGAVVNYSWFSSTQFISSVSKNKNELVKSQIWGIKPWIDVILSEQDHVNVSIRGSFYYPFGTLDLTPIYNNLDPGHSANLSSTDLDYRPTTFSLGFIFQNKR